MRILHVGEQSSRGSAPSVHSQEVRKALRQRGHEVEVFDSVLTSQFAPYRLLESFWAAWKLSKVLSQQRFDLVYCRETWLDPFRALCLQVHHVAWVIEVNGLILRDLEMDGARKWLLVLSRWAQGFTLRRTTGVFAACAAWMDVLKNEYGLTRIEVLQNGVELEAFSNPRSDELRARFQLEPTDLVLGYVGNLGRYYDFKPMLYCLKELVAEFPRFRLLIAGSGPGETRLKACAEDLGLNEWIRFHPPLHHSEVPALIQCFDIGWLPVSKARVRETRGVMHAMKLAEYCASAKPILRVDYAGSDSWAAVNAFSWAVDPDGQNTLAVVRQALQSQDRWAEMGQTARRFAQERLSWEATMIKLEKFVARWDNPVT